MRSSTTCGHNTQVAIRTYSPSVPISVYRELAVELQAAKAKLDSLNAQNQHLAKHNQQLVQEIEKAVQSVLQLQQIVDAGGGMGTPRPVQRSSRPPSVVQTTVGPLTFQKSKAIPAYSKKYFTEQEEGRYRRRSQPEKNSEINGWWLAIAILLIIVTAFGTGYLIVRPLLRSR